MNTGRPLAQLFLFCLLTSPLAGHAQTTYPFDIPAQSLAESLRTVGRQTSTNVMFEPRLVKGLSAPALRTQTTIAEAIRLLLAGTDLTVVQTDASTILIQHSTSNTEPSALRQTERRTSATAVTDGHAQWAQAGSVSDQRRSERSSSASAAEVSSPSSEQQAIEEIVVSAQKRVERLQDVPIPVTVLSSKTLVENNQVLLRDFYSTVPGLSLVPAIQSVQTLSLRGVTTGTGNPTVAVTIDDVPFGASTNIGGGRVIPDIDPGDLARIEVLRGPQGTLYGASSLGGLLKFVTKDPSIGRVSGQMQASASSVRDGDDPGRAVRGSVNVPLGDAAAIRASAFARRDPGYVDDVQHDMQDVNAADAAGGRIAALWEPADRVSLKLNALAQRLEGEGSPSVDVALGDLEHNRLPDSGWYDRKVQAYGATLSAGLRDAQLVSVSSYNRNEFSDSLDFGFALGGQAQALFGVSGVEVIADGDTEKVTQELRLTGPLGERFDWLLGAFYTDEDSSLADTRLAEDPANGRPAGTMFHAMISSTYEEYAAFTNLTYRLSDRFDVQLGARQAEIEQTFAQTSTNAAGTSTVVPELTVDSDAFTYLVTPRFRVTPQLMLYARFASGYRAGGPNLSPGGVVPQKYDPDTTENYELGVKGEFLDRRLNVDASLFHIDWKDIQVTLLSPSAVIFTTNGSSARSRGVELSIESMLTDSLKVVTWVVWNEAELTEQFPAGSTAVGVAGDRLPNSSRWSGYLSAEQQWGLWRDYTGYVGVSASYVGDRAGPFRALAQREVLPSYTQVDLRVGMRSDRWTANIFLTNVGDERGAVYGGLGAIPPTAFTYIQPRTIGLSLAREF
jgi:iron complex outermembrane recepter protein